ncbi:MAG: VanW family protein [Acetivibrio ethanolgignens]
MKIKKYLPATLITLSILAVITFVATTVLAKKNDNTICEGIYINSVDVGGMTKEQAEEAVGAYLEELESRTLTVAIDKHTVKITLRELGLVAEENEVVEEAANIGKTGNFIKRYKEIKNLENQRLDLSIPIHLDKTLVENFVTEKCSAFDIPAENASLKRENGVFVVGEDKTGRKVVADETVGKIVARVEKDWDYQDIFMEAVVMDEEPEFPKEVVELCKDKLGSFSTTYATSSASRANNLANGARLINGSIIWPGETFSTGGTLSPITAENGYSMAGAYQNGQVVDSIGGGVCQVATTLYNAALLAEIEIAERSNHSMIVGYVEPSMDAAIAGTYKDLKLKNNTDVPLYIEAATVGRTITFTIYGHETRDTVNRKIEYVSKVLKVIDPGKEKITEDPTKPADYRVVTQSAHKGYQAELWKVVYENGVEVSREKVNSSSYAAEPAYVTVGTKEEDEEKDKDKKKDKDKDKNKNDKTDKAEEETPEESEEPEETPSDEDVETEE